MTHPPRVGCRCSDECRARRAQYEKERRYYTERGQPLTVPAVGFKRRVRALMALGWTHRQIATELGIATGNLSNRMTYAKAVHRGTHDRMCAVYDRLSMTLPPDEMVNRRTRTIARRNGWLPPLAFDDERIDDAAYRPSRSATAPPRTRRNLLAEVAHLRSLGVSDHAAAQQLGVTVEAIERAEMRARRGAA